MVHESWIENNVGNTSRKSKSETNLDTFEVDFLVNRIALNVFADEGDGHWCTMVTSSGHLDGRINSIRNERR